MSNLIEFRGQDQLIPALESLVGDAQPDLVVVRDFIPDHKIVQKLLDLTVTFTPVPEEVLVEVVPSLEDADIFVAQKWHQIGYTDYPIIEGFVTDEVRAEAISPHVDQLSNDFVYAIAQGSLCLYQQRLYQAERLPVAYKAENGTFVDAEFAEYVDPAGSFYSDLKESKRKPRTEAVINAGDLALFAQHPAVVLHSVEKIDNKVAVAQLITWHANTGSSQSK